jgi:hypothetical protein
MITRHADCQADASQCQISVVTAVRQPMIEWAPLFDGNGVQINSDPNTVVSQYACGFCQRQWQEESRAAPPPPPEPMN